MKTAVFLYLYVTFMDGSASVLVIGPPPGPLPGIVQGFETHEACKAFRDIFMRRLASGQKVAAPTGLRSIEFECAASR